MSERIRIQGLTAAYGSRRVLHDIGLTVNSGEILGLIGPAHSGKTTLLRILTRLLETTPGFSYTGQVLLEGKNIRDWDVTDLRRRVGSIFATPVPLPGTIFDNVAYGPRLKGRRDRKGLMERVERSLRSAFLWDEVKDRLDSPAMRLSGGQQQRLCIARTLAVDPNVILMDEPCSGLDPISTAQIEHAMRELKDRYTFVLVTNNTKQAARVSDRVAFFLSGDLVELGPTEQIFTAPKDRRTDDYLSGRIG